MASGETNGHAECMPGGEITQRPLKPGDGDAGAWGMSVRGGGHLALRYGAGLVLSFANSLMLTRLVGPRAYGLFVAAVGFSTFFSAVARLGIDNWLVRAEKEPGESEYRQASTLMLAAAGAIVMLGAAAAPVLRWWYPDADFLPPYLVLLGAAPLATLAGPAMAKIERALDFRAVARIELSGQAAALVVALPLALAGAGVWAPVAGYVSWQVVALAASWRRAKLWPGIALTREGAAAMLKYGAGYAASVRVWQLRSLVNPLIVGRFAGAEGVAYVALALRAGEVLGFVRTAAGRVAVAALGRWREDRAELGARIARAQAVQVAALGAILCGFAAAGPWVLPRVFGARWAPVLSVYPFVAVGVLAHGYFQMEAAGLFVLGRPWAVTRAYACGVALLAVAAAVLVPRMGIAGYGWAELAACAGFVWIAKEGKKEFSGKRHLWWAAAIVPALFTPIATWPAALALWAPAIAVAVWWVIRTMNESERWRDKAAATGTR